MCFNKGISNSFGLAQWKQGDDLDVFWTNNDNSQRKKTFNKGNLICMMYFVKKL